MHYHWSILVAYTLYWVGRTMCVLRVMYRDNNINKGALLCSAKIRILKNTREQC